MGRIVLVTGGTRGIGNACAHALAEVGAHVVLTSRDAESAAAVADDLQKKHGHRAAGFACDVGSEPQVRRLFQSIEKWSKVPIAAVVNNAGYALTEEWWGTPLHEFAPTELEKAIRAVARVDLDGSRWVTYHALPRMMKKGKGSLVYVSSTPALTGYQGTPYTEAKAGLLGLMRDVARGYGPHGIRANAIAPGNIRTEWLDKISVKARKRLEKENPLRRFGEPREIANAVLFLASDLSSFITGDTLVVDGGTVIR
jgi:NAD(P)-dependent dehydrogenase (short-subunit alcohol dehydrogenase family)